MARVQKRSRARPRAAAVASLAPAMLAPRPGGPVQPGAGRRQRLHRRQLSRRGAAPTTPSPPRSRALADGQQAAFRSLLKRLVPVTAYPAPASSLHRSRAADLIEGVKVRSERNSSTDYIASLDFSFQSKAVRDLLRREGIPFIDEQAPARHAHSGLALMPALRRGERRGGVDQRLEEASIWSNALTPVKLQPLQEGDRRRTPSMRSPTATAAPCARWRRTYGSEYRAGRDRASRIPAGKRLNVTLAGRDAVGAFTLKRAYRLDAATPATPASLRPSSLCASSRAAGRPSRRAQLRPAAEGGGGGRRRDLLIAVEFRGMSDGRTSAAS